MNFDFVKGAVAASTVIGLGCLVAKKVRLTKTSLELTILFRELLHEHEEVTFSHRAGEWRFRTKNIRSDVIREVSINVLEKLNKDYAGKKHEAAFEEMEEIVKAVKYGKWVKVCKTTRASYKYTDSEYGALTWHNNARLGIEVSPIDNINFLITSESSRRFRGFAFKDPDGNYIIDVNALSSYDKESAGYSEEEIRHIVKEAYDDIVIVVLNMIERDRDIKETLEAKLNRALNKSGLTVSDITHN